MSTLSPRSLYFYRSRANLSIAAFRDCGYSSKLAIKEIDNPPMVAEVNCPENPVRRATRKDVYSPPALTFLS
jgi:hypothetical protein